MITIKQDFLENVVAERISGSKTEVCFFPWSEDRYTKVLVQQVEQALSRSLHHPLSGMELDEFEWNLALFLLSVHKGTQSDKWFLPSPPPVSHPSLRKGIEYLHSNLSSPVTLDDLCKITGLSKYYLIRLFQKHVGTTPGQYLQDQRLYFASQLLRYSKKSVTSIAFETGFNSLSAFERAFRNKFGVSPIEYRKKISF